MKHIDCILNCWGIREVLASFLCVMCQSPTDINVCLRCYQTNKMQSNTEVVEHKKKKKKLNDHSDLRKYYYYILIL